MTARASSTTTNTKNKKYRSEKRNELHQNEYFNTMSSEPLDNTSLHTNEFTDHSGSRDRDEVREIQLISAKDTFRIRLWRVVVTLSLLVTAVAVTLTTYRKLDEEQYQNFEAAVSLPNV